MRIKTFDEKKNEKCFGREGIVVVFVNQQVLFSFIPFEIDCFLSAFGYDKFQN